MYTLGLLLGEAVLGMNDTGWVALICFVAFHHCLAELTCFFVILYCCVSCVTTVVFVIVLRSIVCC